ncbi:hypothetical protein SI859A1_03464 [Aurantimonas manganoxydans SI85-9A1]|uniref:Uncharacterized protein n=1 Tax=Aurantimonas manganoxydans (strain ATCC BAA-1229 / DSM 21871 / SI85-9A1) TaxID=287752 RepID=Q1YER9_AURMS|nr:hypothetical protein SI859A1_03464 [Aurantimonas manganoxydans SI85-9A1]
MVRSTQAERRRAPCRSKSRQRTKSRSIWWNGDATRDNAGIDGMAGLRGIAGSISPGPSTVLERLGTAHRHRSRFDDINRLCRAVTNQATERRRSCSGGRSKIRPVVRVCLTRSATPPSSYTTIGDTTGHVTVRCPAIVDPRGFEAVRAALRSRNRKLSAPRVPRDGLRTLVATHNEGALTVPTGIQEWCTRQDSNL